jgi:hypothetical protein
LCANRRAGRKTFLRAAAMSGGLRRLWVTQGWWIAPAVSGLVLLALLILLPGSRLSRFIYTQF